MWDCRCMASYQGSAAARAARNGQARIDPNSINSHQHWAPASLQDPSSSLAPCHNGQKASDDCCRTRAGGSLPLAPSAPRCGWLPRSCRQAALRVTTPGICLSLAAPAGQHICHRLLPCDCRALWHCCPPGAGPWLWWGPCSMVNRRQ